MAQRIPFGKPNRKVKASFESPSEFGKSDKPSMNKRLNTMVNSRSRISESGASMSDRELARRDRGFYGHSKVKGMAQDKFYKNVKSPLGDK